MNHRLFGTTRRLAAIAIGVVSVCAIVALCVIGNADDSELDREVAIRKVLEYPKVSVELRPSEVKVGEKVEIRYFIGKGWDIPAPCISGCPVVRIGFYHRRLKRMVYLNSDSTMYHPTRIELVVPDQKGLGLPHSAIADHPGYFYMTDTRLGFEAESFPKRPGVYLIFSKWWVKHPKYGMVQLDGEPAILFVHPPHSDHESDTEDPRFLSFHTVDLQKAAERDYDHKSQLWEQQNNQLH